MFSEACRAGLRLCSQLFFGARTHLIYHSFRSLSTTFLFFFLILIMAQKNCYVVVPLFFSGEMYLITGKTGLQALFFTFLFSIFLYTINDLSDFFDRFESTASRGLHLRVHPSDPSFFQMCHTLRQTVKNRLILDRITRNFQPV